MSDKTTDEANYSSLKNLLIVLLLISFLTLIATIIILNPFGKTNGGNTPENPDSLRVYTKRILHYSNTPGDIFPNTYNQLVGELPNTIDNYFQSYVFDLSIGDLCNCQYSMCPWESDHILINGNDAMPVLEDRNPPIIEMRNIGNGIFRFSPIPKNIPEGEKLQIELKEINNEKLQNVFFFVKQNEIQLKLSNKDLSIEPVQ